MNKTSIFRILTPLIFYAFYVLYLIIFSTESFLMKWINGCFALFVSLVLCNIIRSRLADRTGHDEHGR